MKTVAAAFFSAAVIASNASAEEPPTIHSHADEMLTEILSSDGGPGVTAAVMRGGEIIWSGAAGLADLENDVPMTQRTRLRIGSVSKPLTAVLTLLLAQDGAVDLDADIGAYVPAFGGKNSGITLRRLASHTAGVRQYDFSNYLEANNVFYHDSLSDAITILADELLVAAPGDEYIYTSIGYNLIGAALESATGSTFSSLIEERLAKPFDLNEMSTDHPFAIRKNRASFYTLAMENPVFPWMKDGEIINTIIRDSSDYYPSGGMLASAEDLATFAYRVFKGAILTKASLSHIETPATLRNGAEAMYEAGGRDTYYTFGWEFRPGTDSLPSSFGHNGETNGAYALVRYFPALDLAVAGIVNYNMIGREPVFFEIVGERLPALFSE